MSGDVLTMGLIVIYVVVACVFAWECNWPKMTYWIGATIITGSVVFMK